jgi:hypothetical protein
VFIKRRLAVVCFPLPVFVERRDEHTVNLIVQPSDY